MAYVRVLLRQARVIPCTVPKGTPVAFHGDAWYVTELEWLERCQEEKMAAAGRPAGLGRATMAYIWAKESGIRINETDVEVSRSNHREARAAASRRLR